MSNFIFSPNFNILNIFVVCLIDFSSNSYGNVTITREGLQILTYARQSWPLSSEGSLACHTYCDTGHPFIMVNLRGLVTLTPTADLLSGKLALSVLSRLGFKHPTFRLRGDRMLHRHGLSNQKKFGVYHIRNKII